MTTYHRIISCILAVAAALALGAAAGPASARPYDLNGHGSYVPRAPGAPVAAVQPSNNHSRPTGEQGAPPILPAPTPSQSAVIHKAEQHAAQRPTLPSSARYSNAEMNAYPSGSSTSTTGEHLTNPDRITPTNGMGQTGAAAAFIAAHRLQTAAQISAAATSPSGDFDWGDAAIGAAGGFAIAILGLGGGLAISQRRSRRTGTSAIVTG